MVKSCRRVFGAVGGESFERVDSWCREACQGLRERQEAEAVRRLCGGDSGGSGGGFRDSTIDARARQQAARFAFFAALMPWRSGVESRALIARTVTRKSSLRREK